MLKALAAPLVSKPTNGWHSSFTAWTTRVSNPVCSPRFRASVSVTVQKAAFATGVPPNIYAFHRYTRNSTFLSCTQVSQFQELTTCLLYTSDAADERSSADLGGRRII